MERKAANRILDLKELDDPVFSRIISSMEALTAADNVSYLHPSKRWEYPWALEQAALEPRSQVLDAGCGASIFPVFLARNQHGVAACDVNVPADLGEIHDVNIGYTSASLTALPFSNNAFSAVFCISVIEHLDLADIPNAMKELCRVLSPGGKLLLTTDFYHSADAEIVYRGPGEPFTVDWNVFDERLLRRFILSAPGFFIENAIDLSVRWEEVSSKMIDFHGYPYTSVGICLKKQP